MPEGADSWAASMFIGVGAGSPDVPGGGRADVSGRRGAVLIEPEGPDAACGREGIVPGRVWQDTRVGGGADSTPERRPDASMCGRPGILIETAAPCSCC
jgi:hypothetical protein